MKTRSAGDAWLYELVRRARAVARNAYAPNSGFRVGAALQTRSGAIHTGCNVENASHGLTVCAERNAIAAAVAAEGPTMRFTALACVVLGRQAFPPCGACRQVMAEFGGPEAVVLYRDQRGALVHATLGDLLPRAFRL